ncbi:MAG: adenine nucleotide alpha hydrolase [Betaproteobacteria bacterium]|nr:adenine nucleotide alpha hydrolase [Betaproteobacteria bacterium]MBU6511297.1 adenine nucleotide alpha hydrolase [Betaproteobacteria bacterium]MDE1954339.1 adenine nucleotide alpha hydrolase [Betaproteobacteria bacterium]MDE2152804.1 adenine nucleotide alpha hydrolase [Betaproteobacteria bacterium]
MRRKTLLSWSSGKDSAWALHVLRQDPTVELAGLFCTVNQVFERVAMHGVRIELLRQQAAAVGLPLSLIEIPYPCSNDEYARVMDAFVREARGLGVETFAFGDLFLEDVRRFREQGLEGTGITPVFPLWGLPTGALAATMVASGLRALITCIDPARLDRRFAGRAYDASFLAELPEGVDPCGEFGEFHSFAFEGPMFEHPVRVSIGETVERDGFVFTDLLPTPQAPHGR